MTPNKPIRPSIEFEGQPYFDKAIYAIPARRLVAPLAEALAEAFGYVHKTVGEGGFPVRMRRDLPPKILLRYEMTRLNWINRDGTPKYSSVPERGR